MISIDELLHFEELLTDEQKLIRDSVKQFVSDKFSPHIENHFNNETFPEELIPDIAQLGLLGAGIQGYGCAGLDAVSYGLVLQELEYGDSGLRSFVSVQGSLAMHAIATFGSEEQKQKWLPDMAAGKMIACFGLTEPDAGSDPGAMRCRATKIDGGYLLNGSKMWITSSPISNVCVVWAKCEGDDAKDIRGFIVESHLKGVSTPRTKNKFSLRASHTGEIIMDNVEIPENCLLPKSHGLGSPLNCLNAARFGISWGVIGAARSCFDTALGYSKSRISFGVPIAKKQFVQEKLVTMATEIVKAQLMCFHYSKIKDKNKLSPYMVSLCKRNNVSMALNIARESRNILGANGIMPEYPIIRHMLNLESVFTYEGTHDVHTLILGRGLTDEDAF